MLSRGYSTGLRELTVMTTSPHWEFSSPLVAGPSGDLVTAVGTWIGPVPSPGAGDTCRAEIQSEDGSLLWQSTTLDVGAPWSQELGLGLGLAFSGVPADAIGGIPSIECEPWAGGGWRPRQGAVPEVAAIGSKSEAAGRWHVSIQLQWHGEPFEAAYTRCSVNLLDSNGVTVAEGAEILRGFSRDDGEASERHVSLIASAVRPGTDSLRPLTTEVDCSHVSPQEAEQGG